MVTYIVWKLIRLCTQTYTHAHALTYTEDFSHTQCHAQQPHTARLVQSGLLKLHPAGGIYTTILVFTNTYGYYMICTHKYVT